MTILRAALAAALAGAILAMPLAAEAQPGKMVRVGLLSQGSPVNLPIPLGEHLRALGWVEGQNLSFERRYDEGKRDRLPALAAELVDLKVHVIFTQGTPAVRAAMVATSTIPIVMVFVADPVRSGVVTSLARPGGNVTGMAFLGPEGVTKQLELLKSVDPRVSTVGLLFDQRNPAHVDFLARDLPPAATALGIKIHPIKVDASTPLETVFGEASQKRADALLVLPLGVPQGVWQEIAALAIRKRLPSLTAFRGAVEQGILMSFSSSIEEQYQRAAIYIDRILRGAKPADLPVEQPTKFDLVINLKTAKAIGLTIPPSVLVRADEVIQ